MTHNTVYRLLTWCIAAVWLVNGLLCKVLNLVPRHQQIVERFFQTDCSRILTIAIGCSEIVMAVWVVSSYHSRINAITQIAIVALMNVLELLFANDLLLWGKWNAFFALIFIGVVYINAFYFKKKQIQYT